MILSEPPIEFTPSGFDFEFAAPSDYARLYRLRGIQVVPAWIPGEPPKDAKGNSNWKRPYLKEWVEYQEAPVPDDKFTEWYGHGGKFVSRENMGMITGRASGNLFVIDLDLYKNLGAKEWWDTLMLNNNNMDLTTVEQITGGGGVQKIYRAPSEWTAPTAKLPNGVDFRGQGGFAMLVPSLHESGKHYEWVDGQSPDDMLPTLAPDWLLAGVEALVREYGGIGTSPRKANGQAPESQQDGFGRLVDGRETRMHTMIWGAVLDFYRERYVMSADAEMPSEESSQAREEEKWVIYSQEIGPKADEAEIPANRGREAFHAKWRGDMRKWHGKVRQEALKLPPPKPDVSRETEARKLDPTTGKLLPLVLTSSEFVKAYRPPDYLIEGVIQKSYIYSLTARTHHGKTAVMLYAAARIARGLDFHGRPTKQGSVLIFAGENPDDVRARWLVLAEHEGFDVHTIPVHFIDGVIDIKANLVNLTTAALDISDLVLVIVDTAAAYFPGDEDNSNAQKGAYARLLRGLTKLPGKPAGVINCHPVKNAAEDNLLPMGGSAFVNEVDGNLTLWAEGEEKQTSLHWQGKFRGPEFEAMPFELRTATADTVKDSQGRCMPSVVAVPITEAGAERRAVVAEDDEKVILRLLHADKNVSFVTLARRGGFMLSTGDPAKAKVQRIIRRLLASKFVVKYSSGKYRLTRKGCKHVNLKWDGKEDDE